MSYMERAIRFLQDLHEQPDMAVGVDEINEGNEISLSTVAVIDGNVWWDDAIFASSAPIRHLPPRECITPRACSRLGPCERHVAEQPCQVVR